jgi:N6-adenosine-specific RNA methylase IME4
MKYNTWPEGQTYNIIYADPPWSYKDTQEAGGTAYFGAGVRYPLMSTEKIKALPVKTITKANAVLFLWITSPLLQEGLDTMKAWGFKYKTIAFVWNKKTKYGKQVYNMGRYTMGSVELCIIGTRGRLPRLARNIKQYIEAERTRHSAKPDEIRWRILQLYGIDLPGIELFARNECPGWDAWGNEI